MSYETASIIETETVAIYAGSHDTSWLASLDMGTIAIAIGVAAISGLVSYLTSSRQLKIATTKAEEQMKQQKDKFDAEVDRRKKEKAVELVSGFNSNFHQQMAIATGFSSGTGYAEALKGVSRSSFKEFSKEEMIRLFDESIYNVLEQEVYGGISDNAYALLDELEYFSLVINHDIADENIVFQGTHIVFLGHIDFLYPLICIRNDHLQGVRYQNIQRLYLSWHEKYTAQ